MRKSCRISIQADNRGASATQPYNSAAITNVSQNANDTAHTVEDGVSDVGLLIIGERVLDIVTERQYSQQARNIIPCEVAGCHEIVPPNVAVSPRISSIRSSWLYLQIRSVRLADPVLIWPVLNATAKSAIVVSSVSPDR